MIMGNARELLTESAICTRTKPTDCEAYFESTIPLIPKNYQSILGIDEILDAYEFSAAIKKLEKVARTVAEGLRAFHLPDNPQEEIHYHHTLHSVAYRLSEGLQAISLLHSQGLTHQIRPLVRSMYELFLNFYIDWLCPEQVGPLLQTLAILKEAADTPDIRQLKRSMEERYRGLVDICSNAAAKGGLSPLGKAFHDNIYPRLSQIVHQDFSVTHQYATTLESGAPNSIDSKELKLLVRWLDLIVTATLTRIADDVGGAQIDFR